MAVKDQYPIALFGASIALVGALCAIRIFATDGLRHWGWVVSGLVAVAFALLVGQL